MTKTRGGRLAGRDVRWDSSTRYQILLKINNAIITRTTREGLFQALATEIRGHIAYDRLSINLYDEASETLSYFAAADGINPEGISARTSRPLEQGSISRMAIESRKPVIIEDLNQYAGLPSVRSMVKAGLTFTMAFPLIVRERTLGTIHFSFRKSPAHASELKEVLRDICEQVAIAVDNMLAHTRLKALNANLVRQKQYLMASAEEYQEDQFFYASRSMAEIMDLARQLAATDASVLITGESGTGKDYLARTIHRLSPRREQLFVKIDCPALTPSLFESELFGHAKGAFTGAHSERIGRFELADGGTVFLDEVGEIPNSLQAKLLHVLQDQRFARVGDSRPLDVDFRVIAATNRDLEEDIRAGRFRLDLYYRLNIVEIRVPPLRERTEDIPLLVEGLTALEAKRMNRQPPRYSESALRKLCRHSWPGNVRELKNLIKRMVILRHGELINDADTEKIISVAQRTDPHRELTTLAEMERRHIEQALIKCGGAVGGAQGAARILGLPRSTLQYRMRRLRIRAGDYPRQGPGEDPR